MIPDRVRLQNTALVLIVIATVLALIVAIIVILERSNVALGG
jgi:hypothetical protein